MDEVDEIIIKTIKSIGFVFETEENKEEVTKLESFSIDLIFHLTSFCINIINKSFNVINAIPPSISARFKMAASLAEEIKALGYSGDIGYHTFLYINENDIRKVLMFLIKSLPKQHLAEETQIITPSQSIEKRIGMAFRQELSSIRLPFFFNFAKDKIYNFLFSTSKLLIPDNLHKVEKNSAMHKYYSYHMPMLNRQLTEKWKLVPSLLEDNDSRILKSNSLFTDSINEKVGKGSANKRILENFKIKLLEEHKKIDLTFDPSTTNKPVINKPMVPPKLKSSRFESNEKLQFAGNDQEVESQPNLMQKSNNQKANEEEEEKSEVKLVDSFNSLLISLEQVEKQFSNLSNSLTKSKEKIELLEKENPLIEKKLNDKKKMATLLPESESNIINLQQMIEFGINKLELLSKQWQSYKEQRVDKYENLTNIDSVKKFAINEKLTKIKDMKQNINGLVSVASEKETLKMHLLKSCENLSLDVNRNDYTQRILEIVCNIKKQNLEIDKVLEDTKQVQKEINQLTGNLERTFIVTDELIFQSAKHEDTSRKAYKLLASLNENCSQVIKSVDEVGSILKDTADIEEQIELEKKAKAVENLPKILADFYEIKKENQSLIYKIKSTE